MNSSILALLMALIAQKTYASDPPDTLTLNLNMTWDSSSLNASEYLVTPELNPETMPANSSAYQAVVNTDKDTGFSPNTLNASSTAQMNSTGLSQIPVLSYTGIYSSFAGVTASPSLGLWPTSNSISTTNGSIWATGGPTPGAQPSTTAFSGRATTIEISKSALSVIIAYHCVMGMFVV